jgi:hypothetical protein
MKLDNDVEGTVGSRIYCFSISFTRMKYKTSKIFFIFSKNLLKNTINPSSSSERPVGQLRQMGTPLSTYERGPSMVGSSCRYKTFFSCLGCSLNLNQPNTKYCFPNRILHISLHLSSSPSKLGRQTCRVAFFLICCNDCKTHTPTMYPCY